jgi:2-polyprenyl-6-methoxyphenol hydroxylase-like FAD-dependent oxidoreductase
MRHQPNDAMREILPKLQPITGDYEIADDGVKIRPADLYVTKNYRRAGVVLVGDAFATSCPAAGTGTLKVFNDVERLCNVHVPRWLATPGMGAEKIAAFYDDPEKQAVDRHSTEKACFLRSLSIDPSLPWRVRRDLRFVAGYAAGLVRQVGRRVPIGTPDRGEPAAGLGKSA